MLVTLLSLVPLSLALAYLCMIPCRPLNPKWAWATFAILAVSVFLVLSLALLPSLIPW